MSTPRVCAALLSLVKATEKLLNADQVLPPSPYIWAHHIDRSALEGIGSRHT